MALLHSSCQGVLLVWSLVTVNLIAARDVIVVTSTDEVDDTRVLEIFDIQTQEWRAVEKSEQPLALKAASYRAESLRPGTARLVENHAVLQYELRNGLSMELASYPQSIEGAATLEYGDTFCLVGGFNQDTRELRSSVLCWNPLTPPQSVDPDGNSTESGGWIALPNMLMGRHQPGAVVMDGKLFVAGGYDTNEHRFLNDVEVFDDVTKKWYKVAAMNYPRAGLQLVTTGGKLFAIGGWRDHRYLDVVEEYHPLMNEWKVAPKLKTPRAKFGAVVTGEGQIYVVGGLKGFRRSDQLRTMEVLNPTDDVWNELETPMKIISGPTWATMVKAN